MWRLSSQASIRFARYQSIESPKKTKNRNVIILYILKLFEDVISYMSHLSGLNEQRVADKKRVIFTRKLLPQITRDQIKAEINIELRRPPEQQRLMPNK